MTERDIFTAALQQDDPAQRQAYLDEACGHQPELRQQVEDLLRLYEEAGSFLQKPAAESAATGAFLDCAVELSQSSETPGTMIGPYKLLQQIGEGGMGVVWMAEQTQPVQRKVALKVIKPGMDSRQVVARFEAERQALAMMDHVNIARVFDGGATEAGRPYFVMELVPGVPITKYCDDNHLTPRARLELFVPVCQAIQHAHQKGIIHRDIKPSNVMVTLYDGKPVPKVIDFGVAKATEQKLTERTLFTQYGTMVGTLEYMSPEQAEMSALGVDTRSDIYSLGVLLYELLTGNTPLTHIRMKEVAYAEILRMIKEDEPPKPSTRLTDSGEALASISANRHMEPGKLTKLVRGELDWIVMRTLEKDRNRRYETAKDFAADVQRYLGDEPVLACPPSAGYRLRKFARRNKRLLATAALLGIMLLAAVGAVTGTVGWAVRDRESREQDLARKAERDLALTEQGVRQAVEQAAKIRGELHAVLTKPGGVQELLNQPGRWNFLIQSAQSELAQARRSTARADGSPSAELTQALHKLEEQLSGDEADRLLALRLEKIRLDKTTGVEGRHDYRKAAAEYPQAFAEFALLKEDAAAVAARLRSSPINEHLVAALDDWAHVAFRLRNQPLAEQLLAVARLAAPDPAWADRLRQLKGWRDQEALGKLVEEAPVSRLSPQMLALVGDLLPNQSSLRESWLRRAQMHYPGDFWLNFSLANALRETHLVEATGFYRVALAVRPTSREVYNNLGAALRDQKKLPEAVAAYHKAIEIDPKFAFAYTNLGIALRDQKKLPEAIAAYHKAIEINPKYARAYINLGALLCDDLRDYENAAACFRRAIEIDPKSTLAYDNLGNALYFQKNLPEAIAAYHKAIEIDLKDAYAYNGVGRALRQQKKLPEAIAAYRKAIELDPKYTAAHMNLGALLCDDLRDYENAAACFRRAIELDPKSAGAHTNLGNALYFQKNLPEAIAAYHKAIEIDPKHANAYSGVGLALRDQKKLPEAIAAYHKAIEIDPKYARAYIGLGALLWDDKRDYDGAIAAFREAVRLEPKNAEAQTRLWRGSPWAGFITGQATGSPASKPWRSLASCKREARATRFSGSSSPWPTPSLPPKEACPRRNGSITSHKPGTGTKRRTSKSTAGGLLVQAMPLGRLSGTSARKRGN
jgi:serine/threonine protein kinase/tetratricopeptide (TPR) repeat protein